MSKKDLNLDSMTIDQLWDLFSEADHHIRITAKKYNLSVIDMKRYKAYAANKAVAMKLRIDGNNDALKYEDICQILYERMNIKQW